MKSAFLVILFSALPVFGAWFVPGIYQGNGQYNAGAITNTSNYGSTRIITENSMRVMKAFHTRSEDITYTFTRLSNDPTQFVVNSNTSFLGEGKCFENKCVIYFRDHKTETVTFYDDGMTVNGDGLPGAPGLGRQSWGETLYTK